MNVWRALETSRGLTAVAASWRERLGEEFEAFKEAFLQRAQGVPKGMPCARGCGCTHEIVQSGEWRVASDVRSDECRAACDEGKKKKRAHSLSSTGGEGQGEEAPSTFRAICRCDPATCPDILLTLDDIVLFELSWVKLSRALCHVFALDYKPADLGLLNTRQIGSWSVDGVPVILTIQHERGWFRTVLLELIARLRQRFILLAPTAKNIDAVSHELLASSDAAFFSVDAIVKLTAEGGLRLANALPAELFAKFTPQPSESDEDVASRAFALVQQLDSQEGTRKSPSLLAVFRMYCIDGLGVTTIARKCRTTRVTIRARVKLIEAKTGMNIDQLRRVSAHLEETEASYTDSRASHIHRKNLIYDEEDAEES